MPSSAQPPMWPEPLGTVMLDASIGCTKEPPEGLTHWSAREIAERVGVSHATVHRIWQAHAQQPHSVETFKFTTDPQAEAKIRDESDRLDVPIGQSLGRAVESFALPLGSLQAEWGAGGNQENVSAADRRLANPARVKTRRTFA